MVPDNRAMVCLGKNGLKYPISLDYKQEVTKVSYFFIITAFIHFALDRFVFPVQFFAFAGTRR